MLMKLVEEVQRALREGKSDIPWTDGHPVECALLVKTMLDCPEKPETVNVSLVYPALYQDVILCSGGMDSVIMLERTKLSTSRKVLYIDYGQPYAQKEIEALKQFCDDFEVIAHVIDVPYWKHICPTRNLQLIAIAEKFVADGGNIWLGVVSGESSKSSGDKSPSFQRQVLRLIYQATGKAVRIKTLEDHTKNDWLKWYISSTGSRDILNSVTCFDGTAGHCGRCQACVRKWIAMRYCDIADAETFFETHPYFAGAEFIEKYKTAMTTALETKNFDHYSQARCEQDLRVILQFEEAQNKLSSDLYDY